MQITLGLAWDGTLDPKQPRASCTEPGTGPTRRGAVSVLLARGARRRGGARTGGPVEHSSSRPPGGLSQARDCGTARH